MADWQPIETAPKDGTPVDLWHKIGTRFTDVWWDDSDPEEPIWSCMMPDSDFTHWMLTPEPPDA